MKFFIDNIWLFGLAFISGGALLWPLLQSRGATLSLLQATQLINKGKTVVVDVRDESEFIAGHLRDSRNIPLNELPKRISELEKFKSKSVIVVCAVGRKSSKATALLKNAGFTNVYSLAGGLAGWQAQGLPTAK